jgi:hypothetical protein
MVSEAHQPLFRQRQANKPAPVASHKLMISGVTFSAGHARSPSFRGLHRRRLCDSPARNSSCGTDQSFEWHSNILVLSGIRPSVRSALRAGSFSINRSTYFQHVDFEVHSTPFLNPTKSSRASVRNDGHLRPIVAEPRQSG